MQINADFQNDFSEDEIFGEFFFQNVASIFAKKRSYRVPWLKSVRLSAADDGCISNTSKKALRELNVLYYWNWKAE